MSTILNDGWVGQPIVPALSITYPQLLAENADLSSSETQQHLAWVNRTDEQRWPRHTLFNTS